MSGISVTRAELYDANVQYVVGDTYWNDEMGDHREASRKCATNFCESIELTYPAEGIWLKVVLEKGKEKRDIMYKGRFLIVHKDSGDDQTRR